MSPSLSLSLPVPSEVLVMSFETHLLALFFRWKKKREQREVSC